MKNTFHKVIGKITIITIEQVEVDVVSTKQSNDLEIINFVLENIKEGQVINYDLKVIEAIPQPNFCIKTVQ